MSQKTNPVRLGGALAEAYEPATCEAALMSRWMMRGREMTGIWGGEEKADGCEVGEPSRPRGCLFYVEFRDLVGCGMVGQCAWR